MRLSAISFRAAVILIVVVSFAILFARGRPIGGGGAVEPLLFASALHQPRGLAAGADGLIYVAEAGVAGAARGRISRLDPAARPAASPVPLVEGLPAAEAGLPLFAQPGPSAAVPNPVTVPSAPAPAIVFLGPASGSPAGSVQRLIGEAGEWRLDPPVSLAEALAPDGAASTAPGEWPPSAPWGAAVGRDGAVYLALPAANRLIRLTLSAPDAAPPVQASVVTGFVGEGQRNPHPTGAAVAPDGTLYVALFGTEPFTAGTGRIVKVDADGRWQPLYDALNFPIALAVAPDGQLFVLEFASRYDQRTGRFAPGSGRLLAVGPSPARRRVVVRDLSYPTALVFSPAGDAYFTEHGALSGAGEGRVLRVPAQTMRLYR
jgi:sugar lactone lactonase YvrE